VGGVVCRFSLEHHPSLGRSEDPPPAQFTGSIGTSLLASMNESFKGDTRVRISAVNQPAPRRPSLLTDEAASTRRISGGSDTADSLPSRSTPHSVLPFSPSSRLFSQYLHAESDFSLAVSEHDDADSLENGGFEIEDSVINTSALQSESLTDHSLNRHDGVTDTPEESTHPRPYEIPIEDEPDFSGGSGHKSTTQEEYEGSILSDKEDSVQEGDDSDFDYEYDNDDDGHFTGFILPDPTLSYARSDGTKTGLAQGSLAEDPVDSAPQNDESIMDCLDQTIQFASLDQMYSKSQCCKWKDPSKEAVSMSLRAEKESTGGRRRLASDLYRIMMQDNEESGFHLEPKNEDSMDKWTIRLFKFDEDSTLNEDLLVSRRICRVTELIQSKHVSNHLN
jgi:hypothetical protein